jgi:hypothetical protein
VGLPVLQERHQPGQCLVRWREHQRRACAEAAVRPKIAAERLVALQPLEAEAPQSRVHRGAQPACPAQAPARRAERGLLGPVQDQDALAAPGKLVGNGRADHAGTHDQDVRGV